MTHKEEIADIRKMLNLTLSSDANENYAKTRDDEELQDSVSYLPSSYTKLSVDIIVDTGDSYSIFNHPLCLYVVNPENVGLVYPVTISSNPQTINGNMIPNDVREFIVDNVQLLTDVANLTISGGEFYDGITAWVGKKDNKLVVEMSTLFPNETGLPVRIYIDDTGTYMNSGHSGSYRIKFQQDASILRPREWMPVTIPDLRIMQNSKISPITIPQRQVNKVIQWAKENTDLLLQLKDLKINGQQFKDRMKTMQDIEVLLKSENDKK